MSVRILFVFGVLCFSFPSVASAQPTADSPAPFFKLRQQQAEYAGPGRDEPESAAVNEVLIGYFGPDDPHDRNHGQMWRAALLAIDRANRDGGYQGKPFRLVAAWSRDPWGTGVTRLTRLVYDLRVQAIVGGVDGPTTHLAEQVVAKARLPLVSPIATDKSVNLAHVPWMFSLAPGDHLIAPPMAAEIDRRLKDGDLMIVSADDHDSHHLTVALTAALAERKLAPKFHLTFQRGKTDFGALSDEISLAAPNCLAAIADSYDSAALVVQVRERGFQGVIFGGPSIGQRPFLQVASGHADGIVFPLLFNSEHTIDEDIDLPRDFDYTAVYTYDAVNLLIAAIRNAGLNRARIGDALRQLSPWQGISGAVTWDKLGSNTRPVTPGIVRQGKLIGQQ